MGQTEHYGLTTTPASTDKIFKDWRLEMADDTNSNMTKIDEAIYNAAQTDTSLTINGIAADAKTTGDAITGIRSLVNGLSSDIDLIQLATDNKVDNAYVQDGYLYMTAGGNVVVGPLGPFSGGGGGGGGSDNNAIIRLVNNTGWLTTTVVEGGTCTLSLNWSSIEDNTPTGNGTMRIIVGGLVKSTLDVAQGDITVNVSPYLSTGTNTVQVRVSDVYGNNKTINFTIAVVVLNINSSFDSSIPYSSEIIFTYTPIGNVSKTTHFIVDGVEIGTQTTSVSNRQQSYVIPAQSHGAHSLRVYFDTDISGQTVSSNELYYEIICLEANNNTPIITSNFNTTSVSQYTTIHILYNVYNPASLTAEVVIAIDGSAVSTQTVNRDTQDFNSRMDDVGSHTISITTGSVTRSFQLTVTESEVQVEAETEALALYLTSAGRSNNEANRSVWSYNDIVATMSSFNYVSDGWVNDNDGNTVLRVAGDARVTIPYQIFGSDFRTTGKTIEVEFCTRDVMNYDSVILSCLSGARGVLFTAQSVTLSSEQSIISTQFKEEEHERVTFVVEKRTENRLIYCYINGIMSGVVQYPTNDDFAQNDPVGISIGSNDCTIDIYNIRVYDNDLNRSQVLNNWIADKQDIDDMLDAYTRNDVYDAYGNIVKEKLPLDLPYLILEATELPQYKGDKKTISGSYVEPLNPERNYTFTGAQFDVQGTSSQYYERKNYKAKYKQGFVMSTGATVDTYLLRDDSIPVNVFCYKADVASSEGANNVELVRLYEYACPYKMPSQVEDSRVRQGIDGYPMVIFWDNGDETTFIGKYNMNNDKSTEEVFGFVEGDESFEVKNNTSSRVLWKTADYSDDDWLNDFEARYPDTDPPYADATQLSEFAEWVCSTDTEQATNDPLPEPVTYNEIEYTSDTAEYRLAKFKAEASDYMEMDSAMFYYLFTELFLMVDSRAKNMFPSFVGTQISQGG